MEVLILQKSRFMKKRTYFPGNTLRMENIMLCKSQGK